MRARSRNLWSRTFASAFVGLLNLPGLMIYLLLRPRETLQNAYARALEEEALLQEIERAASCPNCGQAGERNWQICPQCHHQLRRRCHSCDCLLELDWSRCPACTAIQTDTHYPQTAAPRRSASQRAPYWPQPAEEDEILPQESPLPMASLQPAYEPYAPAAANGYSDDDFGFFGAESGRPLLTLSAGNAR